MRCREFERRLDRSGGRPDPEAVAHAASCARCRELGEMARASLGAEPPPGLLLAGVLARTGGSACGAAGDRLAEWADGTLPPLERELVASHLEGCPACRETAEELVLLARELPALAAIDPGESFTAAVLRATSRLPARVSRPALVGHWVESLWTRPRFPLEAAYAGAIVIWLLFGAAFSPLREVPARAMEAARVVSVRDLTGGVEPASLGREVWRATGGRVVESARASGGALTGVKEAGGSLARHGAAAVGSAIRGDLSGCGMRLKEMGGDLKRAYEEWRRRGTQPNARSQEA